MINDAKANSQQNLFLAALFVLFDLLSGLPILHVNFIDTFLGSPTLLNDIEPPWLSYIYFF